VSATQTESAVRIFLDDKEDAGCCCCCGGVCEEEEWTTIACLITAASTSALVRRLYCLGERCRWACDANGTAAASWGSDYMVGDLTATGDGNGTILSI